MSIQVFRVFSIVQSWREWQSLGIVVYVFLLYTMRYNSSVHWKIKWASFWKWIHPSHIYWNTRDNDLPVLGWGHQAEFWSFVFIFIRQTHVHCLRFLVWFYSNWNDSLRYFQNILSTESPYKPFVILSLSFYSCLGLNKQFNGNFQSHNCILPIQFRITLFCIFSCRVNVGLLRKSKKRRPEEENTLH